MKRVGTLVGLLAAVGAAGIGAEPEREVPVELQVARSRAGVQVRAAHQAVDENHPEQAIAALRSAWHELEYVPGGDAFQDLVAIAAAVQQVQRHRRDEALSALAATIDRLTPGSQRVGHGVSAGPG